MVNKIKLIIPLLLLSLFTPLKAQEVIAFKNIRVFTGEHVIPEMTVLIRGDTIAAVGSDVEIPSNAKVIKGKERTLLPGLIDSHVHTFRQRQLQQALAFGVTTVLDMFTMPELVEKWQKQQKTGKAHGRASIFSAGILATAPGGHGTEYGLDIPTVSSPGEAEAFVEARIAEGSDYIKIIYGDGTFFPVISRATLDALIDAAHAHSKLAVVHIQKLEPAREAIKAGVDGLAHIFSDRVPDSSFVQLVVQSSVFVIPTLPVMENFADREGGNSLADDPRIAPYLPPYAKKNLRQDFQMPDSTVFSFKKAMIAVRRLEVAGVPILAGTDAPNPGTTFGANLHRGLELLVEAGLTPVEALKAATSTPAEIFNLENRGYIAPGYRADLLLVKGNPAEDITDTRNIIGIWKGGERFNRKAYRAEVKVRSKAAKRDSVVPDVLKDGMQMISNFDSGARAASFGFPWYKTSDARMGGNSTAIIEVVKGGAAGTSHALRISGTIGTDSQFAWGGAVFFPGPRRMAPADLSTTEAISFYARSANKATYRVIIFAQGSRKPATQAFSVGTEWKKYSFKWTDFGLDGSAVRMISIVGGPKPGPYEFWIDQVKLK